MPRPFSPKVVTANDLVQGHVVYLTATDEWTKSLARAEILTDEAHADLRLLEGSARSHEVVGVYLADVNLESGEARPAHFREAFRAQGPSSYIFGKQERR